jgi:hypothetical protein
MEKTLVYVRVRRNTYRVLVRRHKGKSHLKDLHVDGRIILRCILQKQDGMVWTGLIWLRAGTSGMLQFPYNMGNFLVS